MKTHRLQIFFLALTMGIMGCSLFERMENPKGSRFIVGEKVKSTEITEGSRELLLRENLLSEYETNPESALKELIGRVLADPEKQEDPRSLFCTAELANAVAERKAPRWNRRPIIHPRTERGRFAMFRGNRFLDYLSENEDILTYYGIATYLSYSYLSFAHDKLETEIYSPRFRRACDIYNYSLSQSIRYTLKRYPHNPESKSRLEDLRDVSQTQFELVGFEWDSEDVDDLLMAEDYSNSDKTRFVGRGH